MVGKLKMFGKGLAVAGLFSLAACGKSPETCSVDADGQIHMNFEGGKSVEAGPAIQLTDDGTKCLNWNGGGTPPDWVRPVVPAPSR